MTGYLLFALQPNWGLQGSLKILEQTFTVAAPSFRHSLPTGGHTACPFPSIGSLPKGQWTPPYLKHPYPLQTFTAFITV